MDFTRLRTLRELSLRKTMAAVADALLLSPSAISQQLTQLEAEAGVPLVDRRGRGVVLTPAGQRLVVHAERIISVLEEARTDLAELKRVVAGELRVAAFPSIASVLLPATMQALRKSHPQLDVLFEELEPVDGLAALRAWQADVALVDDLTVLTEVSETSTETIHVIDDQLYALLPPSNPLAARDAVSFQDLRNERWAFNTASNTYADVVMRACRAAGYEPAVNAKCDSFEVVLGLVETGCSVSVLPGFRIRAHDRICVRKLVPEIHRRISVAFRRGERRNPAVAAFLAQLQASAAQVEDRRRVNGLVEPPSHLM